MSIGDLHNRRHSERLSRRDILLGCSGCLSLMSGVWGVASDDSLPTPKFLLEWGRRGKGEGEFDACVGVAISKNDEVYTAEFRNQ